MIFAHLNRDRFIHGLDSITIGEKAIHPNRVESS